MISTYVWVYTDTSYRPVTNHDDLVKRKNIKEILVPCGGIGGDILILANDLPVVTKSIPISFEKLFVRFSHIIEN